MPRLARRVEADLRAAHGGDISDGQFAQAAVAWVLGVAFVRFAEDNGLMERPNADPDSDTPRSWLLSRFAAFSAVDPGIELFDRQLNPLYALMVPDNTARQLSALWPRPDEHGQSALDLAEPQLDTSLFGDLYQDLSQEARSHYALLQTPGFVTDLLLDLTVRPAIDEFGPEATRVMDPVCGSGHFLLGAFARLLNTRASTSPDAPREKLVGKVLHSVAGVDLNPFAVMISRYRLLMAAIKATGTKTLTEARQHGWTFNVAVGDSLLDEPFPPDFAVVVGNPPYITLNDKERDSAYRSRYDYCTGRYPLTVPFAQRFFQLARPEGYVGLLSSNSFLKRDFGRRLSTEFFADQVTLTHLIDTSGAFIPGHGTPTVLLVGRNRPPRSGDPLLSVLGLRGEPSMPSDPAHGLVWRSIIRQLARPGSADSWTESRFLDRALLHEFPWLLAAGEAALALNRVSAAPDRLGNNVTRIGYFANTGSDDLFTAPRQTYARLGIPADRGVVGVITGSEVRDWIAVQGRSAFFPYDDDERLVPIEMQPAHYARLWPYRTVLANRPHRADRSYTTTGRPWYSWHQLSGRPASQPRLITYSWIATHNHFAALHDDVIPLHSAPIIELPPKYPPGRRAEMVAILNSSTACFWLKHGSNSKGRPDVDQTGSGEPWDSFYEFAASRLQKLPVPDELHTTYAAELDLLAREVIAASPAAVLAHRPPTPETLSEARERWEAARARMVALQEELDWEVYAKYGVVSDASLLAPPSALPPLRFGERAFEIVMARRMAAGELDTAWFTRHGAAPVTEIPIDWPAAYQEVIRQRIDAIQRGDLVRAIEETTYKRRWTSPTWDALLSEAVRTWLLDRCETADLWYEYEGEARRPRPLTVAKLAHLLGDDPAVVNAAWFYDAERPLVDILRTLVADEHVPYLAALRYRDTGLAKHSIWEQVWRRQHDEDIRQATGHRHDAETHPDGTIPPRYVSADFLKLSYWRHRGKYDVPNERFLSYPQQRGPATEPLIGWAGWSNEDRAKVLVDLLTEVDGEREAVVPLLAGLHEILSRLNWEHASGHHGDFRLALVNWSRRFGVSEDELVAWRPPKSKRGRPRKNG